MICLLCVLTKEGNKKKGQEGGRKGKGKEREGIIFVVFLQKNDELMVTE